MDKHKARHLLLREQLETGGDRSGSCHEPRRPQAPRIGTGRLLSGEYIAEQTQALPGRGVRAAVIATTRTTPPTRRADAAAVSVARSGRDVVDEEHGVSTTARELVEAWPDRHATAGRPVCGGPGDRVSRPRTGRRSRRATARASSSAGSKPLARRCTGVVGAQVTTTAWISAGATDTAVRAPTRARPAHVAVLDPRHHLAPHPRTRMGRTTHPTRAVARPVAPGRARRAHRTQREARRRAAASRARGGTGHSAHGHGTTGV